MSKQQLPQSRQIQVQQQSLMYSAPLPPSNEFAGYERTLQGAANRILSMAENEIEHRHKNEDTIVKHSIKKSGRGQIFAFIVALVSLGTIFFSILKGQPLGAIAPGVLALSSLIAVFMGKRQS